MSGPLNITYSTSTSTVYIANGTATATGRAAWFENTNGNNASETIYVKSNSNINMDAAAKFVIGNNVQGAAVKGVTNGNSGAKLRRRRLGRWVQAPGVYGTATGAGTGVYGTATGAARASMAFRRGGSGVEGVNTANGYSVSGYNSSPTAGTAGYFQNSNGSNSSAALIADNEGPGRLFELQKKRNRAPRRRQHRKFIRFGHRHTGRRLHEFRNNSRFRRLRIPRRGGRDDV